MKTNRELQRTLLESIIRPRTLSKATRGSLPKGEVERNGSQIRSFARVCQEIQTTRKIRRRQVLFAIQRAEHLKTRLTSHVYPFFF